MKKVVSFLSIIGFIFTFTSNAMAATTSASIGVGTTVQASCSVQVLGALTFVASKTVATQSSASFNVTCDTGVPYDVTVSSGLNSPIGPTPGLPGHSGPTGQRRLMGPGGDYINYSVFRGDGSTPFGTQNNTGNSAPQLYDIVAELPAVGSSGGSAPAAPGQYSDTVSVVVNY